MSPGAITTRLRDVSRQCETRSMTAKGVEMSVAAVTARLHTLASLSDMCLRLVAVGRGLALTAPDKTRREPNDR